MYVQRLYSQEPNDLYHDDSYSLGGDVENNLSDEDSDGSESEDIDVSFPKAHGAQ